MMARVRAYNSIKFETSQNLLPVLKIVTHTGHAASTQGIVAISTQPGVLFLVQFNNFDRLRASILELHALILAARSYALL